MGDFISAEELKTKSRIPELDVMEPDDIEFIYIDAAERAIELALNLDLNTDRQPRRWAGRMDADQALEDKYREDYARATFLTVERAAANPHGLKQQSVQGASATYDNDTVPPAAKILMRRWSKPRRIGRA